MAKRTTTPGRRTAPVQSKAPGAAAKSSRIDDGLMQAHSEWWRDRDRRNPAYALPAEVLGALATPGVPAPGRRPKVPLLSKSEHAAELAFLEICQNHGPDVVGLWGDHPIMYSHLLTPKATTDWIGNAVSSLERLKAAHGGEQTDPRRMAMARAAEGKLADRYAEVALQQLGYCGKLLVDDQFQDELKILHDQWTAARGPMVFPLSANPACWVDVEEPKFQAFKVAAIASLRKWQLASMASWELPVPQGPTIGPAGALQSITHNQIVSMIPTYFDIRTNRTYHDQVVAEQSSVAGALGIKSEYPLADIAPRKSGSGLAPSEWATTFRLWFIEHAARSRYGLRRGLIDRLEMGVETWLSSIGHPLSAARVKKLRGRYTSRLASTSPR